MFGTNLIMYGESEIHANQCQADRATGVYKTMGCTGLYWAVLGYTGLFWAVMGCTGLL